MEDTDINKETLAETIYRCRYPGFSTEPAGVARLAHAVLVGQEGRILSESPFDRMLNQITEAYFRHKDPAEAAAELIKSRLERS